MNRFRVITADPPWQFQDELPGETRGAAKNYKTMSVEEICRFPLPPLYESSTLFLWRVASMQREALQVIDAWDFELKTEIVWKKLTTNGKRFFGMGRTVRAEHEVCLVANSGKPMTLDKSIRSVFEAPVGRHSEKPEVFYDMVEKLREGPYVELFARRQRPGWTCLGDQMPSTIMQDVTRAIDLIQANTTYGPTEMTTPEGTFRWQVCGYCDNPNRSARFCEACNGKGGWYDAV